MTGAMPDTPTARAMIAAARTEAAINHAKIEAVAASPRPTTIDGHLRNTDNVIIWAGQREYFTGIADAVEYLISGKSTAGIADVAKRVVEGQG